MCYTFFSEDYMKRKLLMLILAICLILPGTFLLTACKPEQYHLNMVICEGGSVKASLDGSNDQAKGITKAEAGVTIFLYNFAEEGFEFDHYVIDGNETTTGYFTMPNRNIDISAIFNKTEDKSFKVQIDYHTDEWTTNPNPTEMPLNQGFTLQKPIKAGYTFIGWSDNEKLDSLIIPDQTITFTFPRDTVHYYPKFEANFNLSEDGTTITSLSMYAGLNLTDIIIPEKIEGKTITTIADAAFRHDHITNFRFGKNVKNFGNDVFENVLIIDNVYFDGSLNDWLEINFANHASTPLLNNLGSADYKNTETEFYVNNVKIDQLTLSSDVKSIKANTFRGFTFLDNFFYEGSLEQYLKVQFTNICSNPAIYGKLYINGVHPSGTLNIPATTNYIQPGAFYNCKNITTVTLPKTVKFIGIDAFAYCSKLTDINLEQVVNIYDHAFYSCSNLTSINLNLIQIVGESAFMFCEKLTTVKFGLGISEIGKQAFCVTNVSEVSLKNASHIKSIGLGAFAMSKITKVELPYSVDKIESQAFRGLNCDNFTITEGVKQFSWDALYDARILTLIIDSEKVYNAITTLPIATPRLNTIKVAKNIVDTIAENAFLHNTTKFTKTLDGEYYNFKIIK